MKILLRFIAPSLLAAYAHAQVLVPAVVSVPTSMPYAEVHPVPAGGTSGYSLGKATATDWDLAWSPREPFVTPGLSTQYWAGDKTWKTTPVVPGNVSAFTNDANYTTLAAARAGLSLTTMGTSGNATYNSGTGVLNVPNYSAGSGTVTSVGIASSTLTPSGNVTVAGNITVNLTAIGNATTYNETTTIDVYGRVTGGTSRTIGNSTLTLVTTATGAGGVQLDATRDVEAAYDLQTSTTSTIGGPGTVTIYFETADTNSTNAGDWTTIQGPLVVGQTVTLAVALQVVQPIPVSLKRWIPAGKYVRIRYATSGTASATFISGQVVKH